MLWKEGLLIKLKSLGIGGRVYNWVLNFLCERKIQVRVGAEYSSVYEVENGTPQGSVCSPLLFNIMINDVFCHVDQGVGRSLYADDGALWIRGRNVAFVNKKVQDAVAQVEGWTNRWGFRLSVAKTQVICFSRRRKMAPMTVKLYGQTLEQELKNKSELLPVWRIVQNYVKKNLSDSVFIFTDGSKDPEKGCVGAAVYIPVNDTSIKKRLSDHLSVYTTELMAVLLALQWIEEKGLPKTVIASDSFSALSSIRTGRSSSRTDIINEIFIVLYRMKIKGLFTTFIWVPAHAGVEGNEKVDILAKQPISCEDRGGKEMSYRK
uniref:RNase H type-1 domain-containing protein n=2 Tax=Sander lucioperca TaxID=283035 RepID=A0A8D0CT46_SANLU